MDGDSTTLWVWHRPLRASHHLECAGQSVLLNCGLFQGHRQQAREINKHLALPTKQLNAVVRSDGF